MRRAVRRRAAGEKAGEKLACGEEYIVGLFTMGSYPSEFSVNPTQAHVAPCAQHHQRSMASSPAVGGLGTFPDTWKDVY